MRSKISRDCMPLSLVSVFLVDMDAVKTSRAKVIASKITLTEYGKLAKIMEFHIKKPDSNILGYYYVNNVGDCLVSCPDFYKKHEYYNM